MNSAITVAITLVRGSDVPAAWPTRPSNLVVLVGLDCRAVSSLSLGVPDVILMVSLKSKKVSGLDLLPLPSQSKVYYVKTPSLNSHYRNPGEE